MPVGLARRPRRHRRSRRQLPASPPTSPGPPPTRTAWSCSTTGGPRGHGAPHGPEVVADAARAGVPEAVDDDDGGMVLLPDEGAARRRSRRPHRNRRASRSPPARARARHDGLRRSPARPPASQVRPAPALDPGSGRAWALVLGVLAVLVTERIGAGLRGLVDERGGREPVLALRRNVTAGQTIENDDLRVVRAPQPTSVTDPIASSSARRRRRRRRSSSSCGRPAWPARWAGPRRWSVRPGGLEVGQAVIAVPVSPEELPADLEGRPSRPAPVVDQRIDRRRAAWDRSATGR